MSEFHPIDRCLPKWPQMFVRGEPMTVDQAKEIIRRTDGFFRGVTGNDDAYVERVAKMLRYPLREPESADWTKHWEAQEEWRARWGWFSGEFVHNTWISSCYVGGPYGWCNPDGQIKHDANVGKWPNSEEVRAEWSVIAREFPWVDCTVVLMDREECEEGSQPVCGFRVSGGKVRVFDPLVEGAARVPAQHQSTEDLVASSPLFDNRRERGVPWSWIKEWSDLARGLFG